MPSLYISSRRAFWVVTIAWVGVIGGALASFAVAAPAYSQGMRFRFTTPITL